MRRILLVGLLILASAARACADDAQRAATDDMNAGTQDMQNVIDVNTAAMQQP